MSHFAVIVIGPDVDVQMEPYHEYESTGDNNEYVTDVDITEDVKRKIEECGSLIDGLEYYGLHNKIVTDLEYVDTADRHKYGYVLVVNDKVQCAFNRTNVNAKWDYYGVGGRWSGFFQLKPGDDGRVSADSARKCDIDFETMRKTVETRAADQWDRVHNALTARVGADAVKSHKCWDAIVQEINDDLNQVRCAYNAQPTVIEFYELQRQPANNDLYGVSLDDVLSESREDYIATAVSGVCVPFAYVRDGKWQERGKMGWWCVVSDPQPQTDWNSHVRQVLDSLPDDTLLTIVDCHI